MMLKRLAAFAREQVRQHCLGRDAADELYKLAIETDQERFADAIRQAVKTTR